MFDRLRLNPALAALVLFTSGCLSSAAVAAPPSTVTITDRIIDISGTLNVSAAQKVAGRMHKFDTAANAPIILSITATRGSAQGVMLLRDAIQQVDSPVVGLVMTQVHGAGAAAAMFADLVVVYPSAGFVFTEVEYEGVKKPKPPTTEKSLLKKKKEKPPTAEEKLLQTVRTGYLQRFWSAVAKRVKMTPAALAAKIDAGGFVITPEQALKTKIAHRRADRVRYVKLEKTRESYKVQSSQRKTRTTKPIKDSTKK